MAETFRSRDSEDGLSLGPRVQSDSSLLSAGDRTTSHGKAEGGVILSIAKLIYKLRLFLVVGWVVFAGAMAPCAWMLIQRASPMTKEPPMGTESSHAMTVFEDHFQNLAVLRRELVVFRCKSESCTSVASVMTRGYVQQIVDLVKRFGYDNPGTLVQIYSYYSFSEHHQLGENPMLSNDGKSILVQWIWRVPPNMKGKAEAFVEKVQEAISEINYLQGPEGLEVAATGLVFLDHAMKTTLIEEIPVHEVSTIWLPFLILAFALRSPRMLLLALIPMPIEILVAFGIMYFVSFQTVVLFYGLMMMLMLCTSLSFDYALFTLTRYAEERAMGEPVEGAILTVISQSGRVVVVSGVVLMIAWGAMLGLPSPFDGFCVSACTMIFVCVLVQLTFTPALLACLPFLGPPATIKRSHGEFELREVDESQIPPSASEPVDDAMAKAKPHMSGAWFFIGGWLTKFPLNVIVPLAIYAFMMPLTLRMSKNFDFYQFKFKMGHSYELTMPRSANEWKTLLRVQKDFPTESGILMPMLIIATSKDRELPRPPANLTLISDSFDDAGDSHAATPASPLDVRGQAFFDANCRMADSLITATTNKSYAVGADNFVSATFHGADEDNRVMCMSYWQVEMLRKNFFSRKVFLSHTSEHYEEQWDQLVSPDNNAMLTMVFPPMDPFSPEAFALVDDLREVLVNETLAAQSTDAALPGLTFMTFSPGSVVKDLIEVTSKQLPLCFAGCAVVCLTLIAFWFGAVFIPFKLLLTVIVPITWTYGAGLYVYEDGFLEFIGFPGLSPVGDAGIDWTVPMFTLTFMMGLALDYEIFLFERVREFREEGFGDCEAIQLGLAATGGTISSAGLIMALTFCAQLLGSIPVTNQMGFILVFSIVVDTFIVRSVLVPAMLSLIPSANYWPSKMPTPRYEWLAPRGTSRTSEMTRSVSTSGGSRRTSRASLESSPPGSPISVGREVSFNRKAPDLESD